MKKCICITVPLVLLAFLIGWRIVEKRSEYAAEAGQRAMRLKSAPSVTVASAAIRDIVQSFETTGSVEAPLDVKIASKITGRIEHLELREGDRVRKGQVLVRIDPSEVEAEVQRQTAAVSEAQFRLAQAQLSQGPTNVSVTSQIRQQKANLASAKADYNQVRKNYEAQLAVASSSLAEMQSRVENAGAGITAAKANLTNARTKYERILELYNQGFTAAQDVDDAKAAVSVQESAVKIAEGQLSSARAQRDAAQQQAGIVKTKGQADIEAARAKVTQAQAALDFAEANSAQKPAYEQSLAALRSGVSAVRAALRSAEAKRADTVLRSPLDGYVTARHVDPGGVATPGQAILTVQFMKQVWITIAVPEEIIPKVHIGQEATVSLDALPGRRFIAGIVQINPSASPESRQFMVRAVLSNSEGLFRPGMFARVRIATEKIRNAVVVPREAVEQDREGDYVMTVDSSGTARRRPVVVEAQDANRIAVTGRISPGDKVIVMSAFPVRDGQPVSMGGRPEGPGQKRPRS